jgi:hypothetical protein
VVFDFLTWIIFLCCQAVGTWNMNMTQMVSVQNHSPVWLLSCSSASSVSVLSSPHLAISG